MQSQKETLYHWIQRLNASSKYFLSLGLIYNTLRFFRLRCALVRLAWQNAPNPVYFDSNHIIYAQSPCEIVSNDQLIIVLVDRFTASAGEQMVDLAFSMENVLVIGQNTAGVLITSSGWINSALPWSSITFDFSADMRVFPEGHFIEGIGFAPDIWVIGDALTAALNMLNHHLSQD